VSVLNVLAVVTVTDWKAGVSFAQVIDPDGNTITLAQDASTG